MATDTSFGMVRVFDDFVLDSDALWLTSADTGGTTAVVADGTAHLGGRLRLATDTTDDDMNEVATGLCFQVLDTGPLVMEARIMVETGAVATDIAITVGFNDDPTEASNTLPVELAGTTFTSNSSTFAGFVYDIDATNDDWHVFSVDDDADTTTAIADLRVTGKAPVADTWETLRVVLFDNGTGNPSKAEFYRNGKLEKTLASTLDRDAVLCAHIAAENRAAAAHNLDVDYIYVMGGRGTAA